MCDNGAVTARAGVLGLDVGTTGVKAVVFERSGAVVASTGQEYPLDAPHPGWAVQDPDRIVAAAVEAMAAAGQAAARQQVEIGGVSVSTVMHSLIALDRDRRPLTPSLTWADGRAAEQASRLRGSHAGRRLAARNGTPVHPMSPLVKLVWFRERDPDTFAAAAWWVGIKEYLLAALCGGDLVVDRSVASATGLYDLLAADWDDEALALAGVRRDQLPALVRTTDQVGGLGAEIAGRVGAPAGVPVVAGGSDGVLANVGLGAVGYGTVACSIGTSGALRITIDRPAPDPDGRVFCYVLDDRHWVVGGATNNGGNVLRWMHRALAPELPDQDADAELVRLAGTAPPGCDGLLMLPYLAGERAPHWSGAPRGVYLGLTHEHRREHLLRAGLEGVCLQLALVLAAMEDTGIEVREIRATGGFARSPVWRQLLADVLGRPIGYPHSPQGSAFGAAVIGMLALGWVDSLDVAAKLAPVVERDEPDPENAALYARLRPLFESLYRDLTPSFEALRTLAKAGEPTTAPGPAG
jgi:gluconokinase